MYFEEIKLVCAVVTLLFGLTLLAAGFWVNPRGIIDSSVLIGFGECMSFCGAVFGIHTAYSSKLKQLRDELDEKK